MPEFDRLERRGEPISPESELDEATEKSLSMLRGRLQGDDRGLTDRQVELMYPGARHMLENTAEFDLTPEDSEFLEEIIARHEGAHSNEVA